MSNDLPAGGIQRLITDRKGDRTYERLARDCRGALSLNRIQQMATRPLRAFPDPDSIQGLSLGLNVSVTEVVMACAVSLDLDVNRGPSEHALVLHGAADLPKAAQESLIDVSRQMQLLAQG